MRLQWKTMTHKSTQSEHSNALQTGATQTGSSENEADLAKALVKGCDEPAVLLNPQDGTIIVNRQAQRLEHLFDSNEEGELTRLASVANGGGRLVTATVSLPTLSGQVVYQVSLVPRVLGNHVLYLFHDQTLDRNLREALIESRQRFKDLVEVSSDFAWEVGSDGCFQFVSRTGALGYASDDLIGSKPEDLMVGADEFDPIPFLTDIMVEDVELWMNCADGSMACVLVSAMPFFEEDGEHLGVRGVCRDVTRERERETALTQAHQREQVLSYIVNTIRDEINPADMLGAAAAATARAMGAKGCSILRFDTVADEGDTEKKPYVLAATFGEAGPQTFTDDFLAFKDGERWLHEEQFDDWHVIAGPCQHAGHHNGVICLWRHDPWSDDSRLMVGDISGQLGIAIEQIANHESIVRLSRTDAMTGLLNRRAFFDDELPRRFKRLVHDGASGALFYIDMDNFKLVNDIRGHQAGDEAIFKLCDVLHDFVRPGDLIARLGGDEFALWLDGVGEETAVDRCGDLLRGSKELRSYSGSEERPLGISVGIAVYRSETGEELGALLARADAAMYEVKRISKGGYCLAPPPGAAPADGDGEQHV